MVQQHGTLPNHPVSQCDMCGRRLLPCVGVLLACVLAAAVQLLPTWFTSCLMAALLVFLTWRLLLRGVSTFIHETSEKTLEQHQHQRQHADDLAAPLLANAHDQDAAATYAADTAAAAAAGREAASSKQQHIGEGLSARMDSAVPGGGDQYPASPAQHSNRGGDSGTASQHSDDDSSPSADADVLPVPAGLKRLVVSGTAAAAAEGGAAAAAHGQPDVPHSGRAFSVEGTPRVLECRASQEEGVTSPILWSSPSSATAADAIEAAGSCPFSHQEQQKFWHQQQRRQALLLPRLTAAGGSSGDGSSSRDAKQPPRSCSLCSCWDPAQLKLLTVQAYTRQQLPWQPVLVLFLLSCWVVASDTSKATLVCGSWRYWLVVLSVVLPCCATTLVVRQWLLAKSAVEEAAAAAVGSASPAPAAVAGPAAQQQRHQHSKSAGVIHWTPLNSIMYPIICSMAGVFAGLFGVG